MGRGGSCVEACGPRNQVFCKAASTVSGVNGTERRRAPVASKIALAIAEGTTAVAGLLHAAGTRGPVGELGEALQQLDAARIVEVAQPEVERIHADGRSELVDEALVRESVLHSSRRADPRRAEGRLGEPVRCRL